MKLKSNLTADVYFVFIVLSGAVYTAFLIVTFQKVFPALIMQLIFLLDAVKLHHSLISVIFTAQFLLDIVSGTILSLLLLKYFQSLNRLINGVNQTNLIINQLKVIQTSANQIVFESTNYLIFTAGFFSPVIYLSSAFFISHSAVEIEAMLLHEQNHLNNYHPLKLFIVNFIYNIYPCFPGKKWIIDNFITATEVASDQYAENQIKTKLPLVSSLYKIQQSNYNYLALANVNYFNSQSERIKILTSQKLPSFKKPLALYTTIIVVFFLGTVVIKNSSVFYDCQHLVKCLEILMTPNSETLKIPDHCL